MWSETKSSYIYKFDPIYFTGMPSLASSILSLEILKQAAINIAKNEYQFLIIKQHHRYTEQYSIGIEDIKTLLHYMRIKNCEISMNGCGILKIAWQN
jgi:hypothetical protein